MRIVRTGLLAGALAISAGCYLNKPDLHHPGRLFQQQLRATVHDPYADANLGPSTDGARPYGFLVPRSPPTKSQWFLDQSGQF
jgi:hypothetical protein